MSLEQWLSNGWLMRHTTSAAEIADLFEIADRDLADCQATGLSDDWRFAIAYNAALQLATAALYAAGFKPARGQSHHLRAIQSLQHTALPSDPLIDVLDGFRVKRNAGTYDRAGTVSRSDVREMLQAAQDLRQRVEQWMAANHPSLI